MQSGHLRHRVTIEQSTPAQNEYGELVESWAALVTVWGAVEPLDGREYFQVQQVQSTVTTRIRIRYRTGITPLMRVAWDGRIFDIEDVIEPKSQRRELHLMCRENQDE